MHLAAHSSTADDEKTPIYIWFDPTSHCNLACEFCYTKHSHGQRHMSPQLLAALLSKLEPYRPRIQVVHLNWRGEPLMNPLFEELLQIYLARWSDTPMHWHTNGTLITERRAKKIVESSKPHKLYVSIDGGTEASHDSNRGAGTFRSALTGLRNLLDANGAGGPLQIGLYEVDFGVPLCDYDPEFLELAERSHQWIRVPPVQADGSEPGGGTYARACFWAGHALCVDPEGKASVCLLARGNHSLIGDLVTDSVDAILTRTRIWRETLDSCGRSAKPQCRSCRKLDGAPVLKIEKPLAASVTA